MGKLIGVQFQKNGKLYYFDSNGLEANPGDYVVVDTSRGHDLGEVVMGAREVDVESWKTPPKEVIRIATEQDIQHGVENRNKEREAFSICHSIAPTAVVSSRPLNAPKIYTSSSTAVPTGTMSSIKMAFFIGSN